MTGAQLSLSALSPADASNAYIPAARIVACAAAGLSDSVSMILEDAKKDRHEGVDLSH